MVDTPPPTDHVWDIDCSSFFPPEVDGAAIHGVYFLNEGTINLMRHILRGLDRGVLDALGYTKGSSWPGTKWVATGPSSTHFQRLRTASYVVPRSG